MKSILLLFSALMLLAIALPAGATCPTQPCKAGMCAGDCNLDCAVDISDLTLKISCVYSGGSCPGLMMLGDCDADCDLDEDDVDYTVNYVFTGGPMPQCQCGCYPD